VFRCNEPSGREAPTLRVMAAKIQHNRRPDVLDAAKSHHWSHAFESTSHGAMSDQFTKGKLTLTCFWIQTPWAEARWESGVLAGGSDGPRGVWSIEDGKTGDGVLTIIKSSHM
jgi:hypothetical protein